MTTKTKLTHVTRDGQVETRQTERDYTHVVEATSHDPENGSVVYSWHLTREAAVKAAKRLERHGVKSVAIREVQPEVKTTALRCPETGKAYVLPLDGDPSRTCPHCGQPANEEHAEEVD